MRRRALLAAATGCVATAGCLDAMGIETSGVVTVKQVWGRVDPDESEMEGPVATWVLEDGDLSASLPADDAPLPTDRPVTIDDAAAEYLEANHGPYDLTLNLCESRGEADGDCAGPTVDREKFNEVRLGEGATVYSV